MDDIEPRLRGALRAVLFPFARLLLRNGIGARPVVALMKAAFVDAAFREHGKDGRPASISRASALTGLTRQEVRNIKQALDTEPPDDGSLAVEEAGLLALWNASPDFTNSKGLPRALDPGEGPGSFGDLVARSTERISAGKMRQRLQERGCIAVDEQGRISMLRREWSVAADLPQLLRDTLATLASTVNYNNLVGPDNGMCQRIAFTWRAHPEKIAICKRMLRERIVRFTEEIDEQLTAIEIHNFDDASRFSSDELGKLGVGAYIFDLDAD